MVTSHRLGYDAEHAVELYLNQITSGCYRPRAGSRFDVGDVVGTPWVNSVKNHKDFRLAGWIEDLEKQVANAKLRTGVVWVKRRGKANPDDWYVVSTGRLIRPMLQSYVDGLEERGVL